MKKLLVLAAALLLLGLLPGCQKKVDPAVWECPIQGLEWGMTADEVGKIVSLTPYQSGDTYTGYLLGNQTLFDTEGELSLWFTEGIGLDSVKFSYTEETPGTLKKSVSKRYGTSQTDRKKGGSVTYGGYWTSDYANTLYTDDEILYAYRMYYKIEADDTENIQELKTFANGNQPLYYVRVIENDDGEGTMVIAATMATVLEYFDAE